MSCVVRPAEGVIRGWTPTRRENYVYVQDSGIILEKNNFLPKVGINKCSNIIIRE